MIRSIAQARTPLGARACRRVIEVCVPHSPTKTKRWGSGDALPAHISASALLVALGRKGRLF